LTLPPGWTDERWHRHLDEYQQARRVERERSLEAFENAEHATSAARLRQQRGHALTPAPQKELPMTQVVDVDELLARLTASTRGNARRRLPGLARAAEHMIGDLGDSATAATPHGLVPLDTTVPPGVVDALEASVQTRVASFLGRLGLLSTGQVSGWPSLPLMTTPAVGAQAGQKLEAPSNAFTVARDPNAATIDASAMLNVSLQLEVVAAGIVDALLRIAVVAEAEAQVVAHIETQATAAADLATAFAHFDGSALYAPTLVVVPPSKLLGLAANVTALAAAGVSVVVVSSATKVSVLDPNAVIGMLADEQLTAVEPSLVGRTVASMLFGSVSVNMAGCAVATA
jgi:hypothetical protein